MFGLHSSQLSILISLSFPWLFSHSKPQTLQDFQIHLPLSSSILSCYSFEDNLGLVELFESSPLSSKSRRNRVFARLLLFAIAHARRARATLAEQVSKSVDEAPLAEPSCRSPEQFHAGSRRSPSQCRRSPSVFAGFALSRRSPSAAALFAERAPLPSLLLPSALPARRAPSPQASSLVLSRSVASVIASGYTSCDWISVMLCNCVLNVCDCVRDCVVVCDVFLMHSCLLNCYR